MPSLFSRAFPGRHRILRPRRRQPRANVEIYYNSARTESGSAYQLVAAALNAFESALSNKFDINRGEGFDLASEKEVVGQLFSQLFPMLMLIFLYSGCMSIAPDSIAGEKERGTLATMLVTPMKRGNLAVGKILSLGDAGASFRIIQLYRNHHIPAQDDGRGNGRDEYRRLRRRGNISRSWGLFSPPSCCLSPSSPSSPRFQRT